MVQDNDVKEDFETNVESQIDKSKDPSKQHRKTDWRKAKLVEKKSRQQRLIKPRVGFLPQRHTRSATAIRRIKRIRKRDIEQHE